jgi:hypothetical protein
MVIKILMLMQLQQESSKDKEVFQDVDNQPGSEFFIVQDNFWMMLGQLENWVYKKGLVEKALSFKVSVM